MATTEPGRRTRPPERVRVVLGDVARQQAARRGGQMRAELEEQSGVGEALVRGLMRAQLGLALRLALVVASIAGIASGLAIEARHARK